jgi:hypothetical protein
MRQWTVRNAHIRSAEPRRSIGSLIDINECRAVIDRRPLGRPGWPGPGRIAAAKRTLSSAYYVLAESATGRRVAGRAAVGCCKGWVPRVAECRM